MLTGIVHRNSGPPYGTLIVSRGAPRDNQADLLAFYGTPGPDVERQLVNVVPPFQMYYDGKPISRIRFHRKAAGALKATLDEIWEHYGRDQRRIDALGISKYAGAYNRYGWMWQSRTSRIATPLSPSSAGTCQRPPFCMCSAP